MKLLETKNTIFNKKKKKIEWYKLIIGDKEFGVNFVQTLENALIL